MTAMTFSAMNNRMTEDVLGMPIDVVEWQQAIDRIDAWAQARESRYVCITNVHSVVTGTQDEEFGRILKAADMVTPDGAPVAWMLRRLGHRTQERINGPDLMRRYCAQAARRFDSIFLYGSTPETLARLKAVLLHDYPGLKIAGEYSPPFRTLTAEEDQAAVDMINASGAGTVWVSLGCPKQEKWMASHRGRVRAVMIGVGAAFDYHAGTIQRAPVWMQRCGLEWFHRLCSEPRRLWKRYYTTNTAFVWGAARQLFGGRR
jgi:N-acetylglucosaminyldiphosphoundecaprenol N-acetyl-beta-D-mannosaminyltransferase